MSGLVEPGRAQIQELTFARMAARSADSTEDAAFWAGVAIGYCAAFDDSKILQDALVEAASTHFANPVGLRELRSLLRILPEESRRRDVWRASGILLGFKDATAGRPDAQECALCARRIITTVDTDATECRYHGWLCCDDCRRAMCPANSYVFNTGCWEE